MSYLKMKFDQVEVPDATLPLPLRVDVYYHPALGAGNRPGVRLQYQDRIVDFEPRSVAHWVEQAAARGVAVLPLERHAWREDEKRFIQSSLVVANPPRARLEIMTHGRSRPAVREYLLPFALSA